MIEFHVYALFKGNSCGVRIATVKTERKAQHVGEHIYPKPISVWYTVRFAR